MSAPTRPLERLWDGRPVSPPRVAPLPPLTPPAASEGAGGAAPAPPPLAPPLEKSAWTRPPEAAPTASLARRTRAAAAPAAAPSAATGPLPVSAAPPSPGGVASLEAEIDRAMRHEHVAKLAVHLCRAFVPAAAYFQIRHGLAEGVCAEGAAGPVDRICFRASDRSVFAAAAEGGEPFRGAPPVGVLEARVLRQLGRDPVREMAVLPILLRGRALGLLYADNGPEVLGDASYAALQAVARRVTRAYARLILERKRARLETERLPYGRPRRTAGPAS